MRVLESFVSDERGCSYLPEETASLAYRVMIDVEPAEWESMLERGWRRFGVAYFRPACPACSECVPIRVPLDRFTPSKGQRRVARGTAGLRLEVGVPRVTEERLELYREWHRMQSETRGWADDGMNAERYFHEFAFPHPSVREYAYYDADRLVAIAIVDETPNALSAVYTFHDPALRKLSLGTASVLRQIEMGQRLGKRWLYLGYRVLGCVSSQYKAKFRPHELLEGWPRAHEVPVWGSGE